MGKKNLTKHEAEIEAKKLLGGKLEELDALGQESEIRAVKWVKEKGQKEDKRESEKRAEEEWRAVDSKGKVFTYRDAIYNALKRQMLESYGLLPYGFLWYPVKAEKGLEIWIRDTKNQWYARGMYLSSDPKYDLNCVDRLVDKALNQMDILEREYTKIEEEKKSKKTDSGIILP